MNKEIKGLLKKAEKINKQIIKNNIEMGLIFNA